MYIDFNKFKLLASVYSSIQLAQQSTYSLIPVSLLQDVIKNTKTLEPKEIYNLSYLILPRGTKKERKEGYQEKDDGMGNDSSPSSASPLSRRTTSLKLKSKKTEELIASVVKMEQAVQKLNLSEPFVDPQDELFSRLQSECDTKLTNDFPNGYRITSWKKEDTERRVFEWNDIVKLYLVQPQQSDQEQQQQLHVVDVALLLTRSSLSLFLRKVAFFRESETGMKNAVVVSKLVLMVTAVPDLSVKRIAETNGVDIFHLLSSPTK
eukprot:TRINITY_DN4278_c0_g3_i1.p1 TRINITY_DN4278_c0_g3~~TRINITY_DN4278_c0_g3_i1.p1  ORF type:complete len:277 (+),score=75.02 TRINITY_DN4278_c0_g3_i1:42-833(+)